MLLFLWFAWQTYARISFFLRLNFPWGLDATIYYRGVVAWLHGADPWAASVTVNGYAYHYAGSPVTTVLMAPLSVIGEQAFTYGWLGLTLPRPSGRCAISASRCGGSCSHRSPRPCSRATRSSSCSPCS